jgi:hypothetical protein
MNAFSRMRNAANWDHENIILGSIACDDPLLCGEGTTHPAVAPVLKELSDVLISKIPGGMLPERIGIDDQPVEDTIEVAPGTQQYARPPRMFTPEESIEIRRYLTDFLNKKWIVPSLSPWAAPALFVPKKADPVTGKRTWRMVISCVKLNSKTLNRIAYRPPRITELLARVSQSKYSSKLDPLGGFYQIRMRESDAEKTAITTPFGNFHFRVMPMGSCGAPGTLQRVMHDAFHAPVKLAPHAPATPFDVFLAIYLDDSCIHSAKIEDHIIHLRAVLTRLRETQFYAKHTKCQWLRTSIESLGHTINDSGLCITTSKVAAVQMWPAPRNLHELRSLLGTFGFWRCYIHHYAHIRHPLTLLTLKGVAWR